MRNPAACLLWLEGSETMDTRPIDALDKLLFKPEDAGLRRAFALWLTTTFLPSRMTDVNVPATEKLKEVSPMMTANSIDWSRQWKEEGWRQGEAEGVRKGRQEGRQEGEADLLLRQLSRLYGPLAPATEERIRGAEADQLLEWGERLVTSGSLDEVFGRGRDD